MFVSSLRTLLEKCAVTVILVIHVQQKYKYVVPHIHNTIHNVYVNITKFLDVNIFTVITHLLYTICTHKWRDQEMKLKSSVVILMSLVITGMTNLCSKMFFLANQVLTSISSLEKRSRNICIWVLTILWLNNSLFFYNTAQSQLFASAIESIISHSWVTFVGGATNHLWVTHEWLASHFASILPAIHSLKLALNCTVLLHDKSMSDKPSNFIRSIWIQSIPLQCITLYFGSEPCWPNKVNNPNKQVFTMMSCILVEIAQ